MTQSDWNRIEELFNAAIEQPEEKRMAFLEDFRAESPALLS